MNTVLTLIVILLFSGLAHTQAPSIRTGVTFQWQDVQNTPSDPANLESITINDVVYNTFVVPSSYEFTRLGPNGHNFNQILRNGNTVSGSSNSSNWNTAATSAFQDTNLNHYFTSNRNGRNICNNFNAASNTNAQRQTIFYEPAIPSNEDGIFAVTERNANNCYYIEVYGTPNGGGEETLLGNTFVKNNPNAMSGPLVGPPADEDIDYWNSGRVVENNGTIGIALFYLKDIAPLGSKITKIEFIASTVDHGDGKFFILQTYAVDKNETGCINETFNGNLYLTDNVPENSTYSLLSGPSVPGQSFTLDSDGTYEYIPTPGFIGDVTFEYEVCLPSPNTSVCDQGLVTLTLVSPPEDPTFNIDCNALNDTFDLMVTSPLGPEYEYAIGNGIFQSSPNFNNLSEGSYNVAIKNIFTGCENESTPITLSNISVNGAVTNVLCHNESTGAIDLTVSGGTMPYDYAWSPNGETTEDINNLSAGTYTVTVTDANGCEQTKAFTINQPLHSLSASVSTTDILCKNESTGAIDLTVNGGTAPYSFIWSNGSTTEDVSGIPAGAYSVTITDANNCTATVDVTVTEPTTELSASVFTTDVLCKNESTGAIDLIVSGGTAPYSFTWSNGSTTEDVLGIPSGAYSVTITDANNCTTTVDATINEPNTELGISLTQIINSNCGTTSSGSISAEGSGGTPPYDYSIDGIAFQNSSSFDNLPAGNYTLTIRDSNGCTATINAVVTTNDNDSPEIFVPSELTIEGCDATDITDTNSVFGFSETISGNILEIFNSDPNYNVSDDFSIQTVTYFDAIVSSSDCPVLVLRTFTVTDDCGNTANAEQTIRVQDTTAPAFMETLPADVTVECDAVPVAATLNANDNCGTANVTFNETVVTGTCDSNYTINRTWTATDSCGNEVSHTQSITVQDTTAPTFAETLPADVTVECDEVPAAETLTANDDCGTANVTFNETVIAGTCDSNYTINRTWTAKDSCGNEVSHTQSITVQDTTAPTFVETLPADVIVECDAVPVAATLTAIDNCSTIAVIFEESIVDGSCHGDYSILRTWTATDNCNNEISHTQIITVQDTTAPVMVSSSDFEEYITAFCDDIPARPDLVFEDACAANISVEFNEVSTQTNESEDYEIIRTWTLADDCGNGTTYTQTVSVQITNIIEAFDTTRCILDEEFNLFDLLSGDFDMNGTWSVVSGNTTIDSSLFNPNTAELGVYTFKYEITEGSCPTAVEVNVTIDDDCVVLACGEDNVAISKTVTANGDAYNEYFTVTGVEDCGFEIELQIFNRWGAKIYESNNYQNDWNGNSSEASVGNSGKVPTGTYYYIINLKNSGLKPFAGPIYVATTK